MGSGGTVHLLMIKYLLTNLITTPLPQTKAKRHPVGGIVERHVEEETSKHQRKPNTMGQPANSEFLARLWQSVSSHGLDRSTFDVFLLPFIVLHCNAMNIVGTYKWTYLDVSFYVGLSAGLPVDQLVGWIVGRSVCR